MEKLIFNKIVDANRRVAYAFIHVPLLWLNFSGREGRYNPEGKRNFNILLPQDVADQMRADGFNVKEKLARDENEEVGYTMKVNVNMKSFNPPTVLLKNNHGVRELTEDSVCQLDTAIIMDSRIMVVPHHYEDFTTAYLKELEATVYESPLDSKYLDEEDSATNTMTFAAIKKASDE